jgi:UDP-glucose 4-epimerase
MRVGRFELYELDLDALPWARDLVAEELVGQEGSLREAERLSETRRSMLEISRAKRELGWQPRVGLGEGLRLTWQSLRK